MYAHRVDAPQPGIVAGLRSDGATVRVMSKWPGATLDLLVRYRDRIRFLEVKTPGPPSSRKLTDAEAAFIEAFGPWCEVVTTLDEARAAMGMLSCARDRPPQPG